MLYGLNVSGKTRAGNRRRRKADPFATHIAKFWTCGLLGKSQSGGAI
tara:strand:- start:317 stop:457 length:141 start_codon:yes stop_codon:yes gene_type:complete